MNQVFRPVFVAPHDGCVDWNCPLRTVRFASWVAPHDGCVDWNMVLWVCNKYGLTVAPHDGCVDWNSINTWLFSSYSGRTPRWVRGLKYLYAEKINDLSDVAPHDGCVDWNLTVLILIFKKKRSHPTMGAWIEIFFLNCYQFKTNWVAPHDGCVDWNATLWRYFKGWL